MSGRLNRLRYELKRSLRSSGSIPNSARLYVCRPCLAGELRTQKAAHAEFDGGRKLNFEPVVNPPYDGDGIAGQIRIVDIEKCLRPQAPASIEKSLQRIFPVHGHLQSDGSRIDIIAKDALKHRRQTGCGGEDFERFPMRLHDESVRIGLEKGLHRQADEQEL